MTLRTVPLDGKFAFEVESLELWRELDDASFRELDDIWSSQGVVVFRR